MNIILASNSPRRTEILNLANVKHTIIALDHEEKIDKSLNSKEVVMSLAHQKAWPVHEMYEDSVVIGADTIVLINNQILGKPKTREDAFHMLKLLINNEHSVITGVSILQNNHEENFYEETKVTFTNMTDDEIYEYIDHENIYDKAGSYAIQGMACRYISSINGDFYNVMGLPIAKVVEKIKLFE